MAEINKIKVGETTYDINTKYFHNTGGYTCLGDGSSPIIIGTNAPYSDNKVRKAIIFGSFVDIYDKSGGLVNLGSLSSASIKGITVDADNLYIGTGAEIQNIYIGTTPWQGMVYVDTDKVRMKATNGYAEIGAIVGYQGVAPNDALLLGSGICGKKQNIQVGLDDTNISVMALDSSYNKLDKVSIKASTIDLPTATKLYFNGIPISKSGNALIFDDRNTELSLNSGWRLTKDTLTIENINVQNLNVLGTGSGGSSSSGQLSSLDVVTGQSAILKVEDSAVLAMWSGYGMEIGEHNDGSRSVHFEGNVEIGDFGNLTNTVNITAHSGIGLKMDTAVGLTIDRNTIDAYASTCRIGAEDIGSSRAAYMRAHPYSSIDVAHGIEVTPTEILIDDFKFECDKENSKLIISYNGKKAEIQLN